MTQKTFNFKTVDSYGRRQYDIKAQITEYKGIKFRSKLESEWAKMFDSNGIVWEYEPKRFCGRYYQPDFYLFNLDIVIEVKPTHPTDKEIAKCSYVSRMHRKDVYLVFDITKPLTSGIICKPDGSFINFKPGIDMKKYIVFNKEDVRMIIDVLDKHQNDLIKATTDIVPYFLEKNKLYWEWNWTTSWSDEVNAQYNDPNISREDMKEIFIKTKCKKYVLHPEEAFATLKYGIASISYLYCFPDFTLDKIFDLYINDMIYEIFVMSLRDPKFDAWTYDIKNINLNNIKKVGKIVELPNNEERWKYELVEELTDYKRAYKRC